MDAPRPTGGTGSDCATIECGHGGG
jgi:hypothetical protein